jgi:hypothetical protein
LLEWQRRPSREDSMAKDEWSGSVSMYRLQEKELQTLPLLRVSAHNMFSRRVSMRVGE